MTEDQTFCVSRFWPGGMLQVGMCGMYHQKAVPLVVGYFGFRFGTMENFTLI